MCRTVYYFSKTASSWCENTDVRRKFVKSCCVFTQISLTWEDQSWQRLLGEVLWNSMQAYKRPVKYWCSMWWHVAILHHANKYEKIRMLRLKHEVIVKYERFPKWFLLENFSYDAQAASKSVPSDHFFMLKLWKSTMGLIESPDPFAWEWRRNGKNRGWCVSRRWNRWKAP